jgi:glycogen operon protein
MNAHHEEIPFTLPGFNGSVRWRAVLDTRYDSGMAQGGDLEANQTYPLQGRSFALLIQPWAPE